MNTRLPVTTRMAGFSLVELMVAVTIGLILLAAVAGIFVSSKRSYSTQDRLARLQENARFAVQAITRDLRMAGYSGCLDDITLVNNTLNSSYEFNVSNTMEGINGSGNWSPSGTASGLSINSGTDAITIRKADATTPSVKITKQMNTDTAELDVDVTSIFQEGQVIMVTDCASADIMQITAVQTSAMKLQHAPSNDPAPGNDTQKLSKKYGPTAKILFFSTTTYFVGPRSVTDSTPVLFRKENSGNPEELVEGVESLQILYGKDTDTTPDGVPNIYLEAGASGLTSATDWANVKSVRIGILLRTPNDKDADVDPRSSYDVNGTAFSVPTGDKFQRRVFQTTIQLRNLI
jgi:type IV pilus assembly protein PilW